MRGRCLTTVCLSLLIPAAFPDRDGIVPSAPIDVKVGWVTETAVRVSWSRPAQINGILLGYYVYKDELKGGQLIAENPAYIIPAEQTYALMAGLKPNTEYSFRVQAYNRRGDGAASAPIIRITEEPLSASPSLAEGKSQSLSGTAPQSSTVPAVSPAVQNLRVTDVGTNNVALSWLYTGPRPVRFYVQGQGRKSYMEQNLKTSAVKFNMKVEFKNGSNTTDYNFYTLTSLRPHCNYSIKVGVVGEPISPSVEARTRMMLPPFLDPPTLLDRTVLRLTPATEEYGTVAYYWLVLVPLRLAKERRVASFSLSELKVHTKIYIDPTRPYIAANFSRQVMHKLERDGGLFHLGDGSIVGGFTNRPLHQQEYQAFLRAFVSQMNDLSYIDSMYSKVIKGFSSPSSTSETLISGKSSNLPGLALILCLSIAALQ